MCLFYFQFTRFHISKLLNWFQTSPDLFPHKTRVFLLHERRIEKRLKCFNSKPFYAIWVALHASSCFVWWNLTLDRFMSFLFDQKIQKRTREQNNSKRALKHINEKKNLFEMGSKIWDVNSFFYRSMTRNPIGYTFTDIDQSCAEKLSFLVICWLIFIQIEFVWFVEFTKCFEGFSFSHCCAMSGYNRLNSIRSMYGHLSLIENKRWCLFICFKYASTYKVSIMLFHVCLPRKILVNFTMWLAHFK